MSIDNLVTISVSVFGIMLAVFVFLIFWVLWKKFGAILPPEDNKNVPDNSPKGTFWNKLLAESSIFAAKTQELFQFQSQTEEEKLFNYLFGLFHKKSVVVDQWESFLATQKMSLTERESARIPIYFQLENLLLSYSPPEIEQKFTKEKLYEEIGKHIFIENLPEGLKIIFGPKTKQLVYVFELGVSILVDFISDNLGLDKLTATVAQMQNDEVLKSLKLGSRGLDFGEVNQKASTFGPEVIIASFRKLYASLFNTIKDEKGTKVAEDVLGRSYDQVRSLYTPEIANSFIEVAPASVVADKASQYFSHDKLEEIIRLRTKELEDAKAALTQKVTLVETQNFELEKTKKAMQNLLEDAHKLEDSLKKERDQAQAIISSVGEGLAVVDKDARIQILNKAAQDFIGSGLSETKNKPWTEAVSVYAGQDIINPEDDFIIRTLKTGQINNIGVNEDIYFESKSTSRKIPVALTTAPIKVGLDAVGGVIVFRDVTRDKEIQVKIQEEVNLQTRELREKNIALQAAQSQITEGWLQLQKEKARLSASINSLDYGYILTDINHDVVMFNKAAHKLLGVEKVPSKLSEIEEIMKNAVDIHALHNESSKESKLARAVNIEYRNMVLEVVTAPVMLKLESYDEVIGILILIIDTTRKVQAERARDEFFTIASHELRTPLTIIRGNSSNLLTNFASDLANPQLKEMVKDIEVSSTRLIAIVNDFLDTSALELNKIEFKKTLFRIDDIFKVTLGEMAAVSAEKNIKIEYSSQCGTDMKINADWDRLKQVLLNLIGNSIKFTDRNGNIKINSVCKDGFLEVAVADTGCGIDPQLQSKLFQKFQKAGVSPANPALPGTGLGLYISKLIIESMGGKIWLVESNPGSGSTFAFKVPAGI